MKTITFHGAVVSGEGDGKRYLALPWVRQQIEQKLGYTPYSGTLNLKLKMDDVLRKKTLEKAESEKICPNEGYCVGLIFKATINELKCAVVIPQVQEYPDDLLEVISQVNLRKALNLNEGSVVTVSVSI